jgi:hypothetical protein
MEKKTIKLTESDLRALIKEAVETAIQDMETPIQEADELEENWFTNKVNQGKAAVSTLTQKGDVGLGKRIKGAVKNWGTQGDLNVYNELSTLLRNFIAKREITTKMTVGELLKRLGSMKGNKTSQISKRGGVYYQ